MEENVVNQNISSQNHPPRRSMLPNATATLVLGIISIAGACCYGGGLILAIIALAISGKSVKMYNENPEAYDGWGNLKAGRVCAIIGLSISALWVIIIIIYLIFVGSVLSMSDIWSDFNF
jgi:hypothetical protein